MQPTEGQKKEKATAFIWSFMEAFCINPTNSCTNSILLLAQLCTLSRFQVKRGNIWFQFPLPSALPSFGNLKGCLFINRDLTAPKTWVSDSLVLPKLSGELCSTTTWNALALKNTQRIIATPSRPTKNTKNHFNAGACADLQLRCWFRSNTLVLIHAVQVSERSIPYSHQFLQNGITAHPFLFVYLFLPVMYTLHGQAQNNRMEMIAKCNYKDWGISKSSEIKKSYVLLLDTT
jgi:hypothetical protein